MKYAGYAGAVEVDEHLARRLVDGQFPAWAGLPVRPVELNGWDNRTFRLGDELTVRLPSGDWYALQVAKEQRWLPVLAPHLPLPVPTPVAQGVPGHGYPYPWSVYRWLDGRPAAVAGTGDATAFATDLARFLAALRRVDATDGPAPGEHNFYRGGPVAVYEDEVDAAVEALGAEVPRDEVLATWEEAVASVWRDRPTWFHGDVAPGNLLVRDGALAAVIDFGTSGVGDPACDVVIAWTTLSGDARDAFRRTLGLDPGTWARGRGWALWKALISLVGALERDETGEDHRRVVRRVLADRA
ncbi:aminoglycoside phosphotransferase family protein [Saccharothrix sp. Mg75]|uniref:aminoglycoside phosphotransferase family protein n=1 Tax=Saccharothrix sp. Mg75 TaxID=3445357 RepID=UPI003EEDA8F4